MKNKTFFISGIAAAVFAFGADAAEPVKSCEAPLVIPTYVLDAPEKAPIFDCDWSYQRARRSIYPYVLDDNMTRTKKNVTYKALYLENEYIKLCVLPEIGGRLFYAIDKTNNYDIFYHQDVVKPANVGMTGAWISGGVEWNVFHHHRATSHSPVDYAVVANPDGSKTIWIGETELRHRMSWAIGITLRPGKSYMEISGRLMNSTKNANSVLYWSNVSTRVDENYQIIFPQNTEFGTFHCKESFCHWPVTNEVFTGKEEYKDGIEASWWKNHPASNSIFVHELKDDFIAGYDHGRKAGTMLVGNHHIVKGGKFWSWGPNSGWPTKILTDTAGHYIELMTGAYSDNQPDYNWMSPYESKTFSSYWYGIRDMGGVKKGSKDAAINMDLLDGGKVLLGINTTQKFDNLVLTLSNGDKKLFSKTVSVAPDSPYVETVEVDKALKESDLTLTLKNAEGKTMLSYTPIVKDISKPLPEIVKPPLPPAQIANAEECYLVGLRNLQFHNPFVNPVDYFEEVLRRDNGDTRANTQMGVYWRLRGDYEKAKPFLQKAIARQTKDYTRSKDCEAIYNLGLILKDEGKTEEAIDTLYRAVWNYTYNSAANFQLAQIYAGRGDFENALERLDEAVTYNGRNIPAINLQATILRESGDKKGAQECVDKVLRFDPVNLYAAHENMLLNSDAAFRTIARDNVEMYLELAMAYINNGFAKTAKGLLEYIDAKTQYPTVKLWLGELARRDGNAAEAQKLFQTALSLPIEYCNPFRIETMRVFESLLNNFPNSDRLHYYLGNIYYDKDAAKGMAEWQKAVKLNPKNTLAWRNIGYGHWKFTRDYAAAANAYAKAVELEPAQPLFLEEYDQVLEFKGEDMAKRYAILKSKHDVCVKRYSPLASEVVTGTFVGDYDYVLKLLRECYFPTREGVANFHDVYVDAVLLAGADKVQKGKAEEGIALMKDAFKFPENHQVYLYDTRTPRDAQIYCFIGDAYAKIGDKARAEANYKKACAVKVKKTNYRYWQALALQNLGKKAEAEAIFAQLASDGKNGFVTQHVNFYGAEGTTGDTVAGINSRAYYTKGLGELGLGKKDEAKESFKKSAELNPNYLWSDVMLRNF